MDFKIKSSLQDIIESIEEIFFFLGNDMDFDQYQRDTKTKKAVERNIEIIGEAVNRILKVDPNFPLQDSRKIIGTRNRIIHNYDNISDEILWDLIHTNLPDLKMHAQTLLLG